MKVVKSNSELLLLLKQNDKVAFYNLYEKYGARVYSFIFRFLKHEQDTEEILQDVFITIWTKRHTIRIDGSFESYLFTIAYNSTVNLFRKRLSEKKYLDHIKSLQSRKKPPSLIDEVEFNDLKEQVGVLLQGLTPRQKEIYLLSREAGLTHDEIAKKLDISSGTVKKHLSNILAYLRNHMAPQSVTIGLIYYLFS